MTWHCITPMGVKGSNVLNVLRLGQGNKISKLPLFKVVKKHENFLSQSWRLNSCRVHCASGWVLGRHNRGSIMRCLCWSSTGLDLWMNLYLFATKHTLYSVTQFLVHEHVNEWIVACRWLGNVCWNRSSDRAYQAWVRNRYQWGDSVPRCHGNWYPRHFPFRCKGVLRNDRVFSPDSICLLT